MSYTIKSSNSLVSIQESQTNEKYLVTKKEWIEENKSNDPQKAADNIVKRLG